jgi:hypothetical protein
MEVVMIVVSVIDAVANIQGRVHFCKVLEELRQESEDITAGNVFVGLFALYNACLACRVSGSCYRENTYHAFLQFLSQKFLITDLFKSLIDLNACTQTHAEANVKRLLSH